MVLVSTTDLLDHYTWILHFLKPVEPFTKLLADYKWALVVMIHLASSPLLPCEILLQYPFSYSKCIRAGMLPVIQFLLPFLLLVDVSLSSF